MRRENLYIHNSREDFCAKKAEFIYDKKKNSGCQVTKWNFHAAKLVYFGTFEYLNEAYDDRI